MSNHDGSVPEDFGTRIENVLRRLVSGIPPDAEPRAVGGFLRDALMGRPGRDIDLTVSGDTVHLGQQLAQEFDGTSVVLSEDHQVVRLLLPYQDSPFCVDLVPLQKSPLCDLNNRDFTIDAMSIPLADLLHSDWANKVTDPFGGRHDLENRLIRMVRTDVFQNDGLRLLRAVRLAASLGFEIEEETKATIMQNTSYLEDVSWERIRDEFLIILSSTQAMSYIYLMDNLGLLCKVIPELEQGRKVSQPKEHYWNVLEHNIETVGTFENLISRSYNPSWVLDHVPWSHRLAAYFKEVLSDGHTRETLARLACLLHDVAKPATRTVEMNGRIRFLGHHSEGATMVKTILQRLRLSRRTIKFVQTLVHHHLRPGQMSQGTQIPTARAIYRFFRNVGDAAVDTIYLNLSDYLSARGPLLKQSEWTNYAGMVSHTLETGVYNKQASRPKTLLDGNQLMTALELKPGPTIGRLLEGIREAQAASGIVTEQEALQVAKDLLAVNPETSNA